MGLAGVVLLSIALRISPLVRWPQIVRVPFGFSGILLIDVSLGFGAFLFATVMEICLAESGTYVSGSRCSLVRVGNGYKATGTSTSWEAFVALSTFLLPHPLWKAHA